jgi:zinc protease
MTRAIDVRRRALVAALAAPAGLVTIGLPGPAAATPGVDEPPLPQPPRPLQLPEVVERRLDNGLVVQVAQRPGLPLVSLVLALRTGPEADPPGRSGTAEMLATLWPKGAQRGGRAVGAAELARQAEALGSPLDARSSWGLGTLAMTVTSGRAEAALALLADVLRRPLLAADELDRARAQALDALRLTLGSPGEVASLLLRRSFWGDVPQGRVAAPAALQRLAVADLRAFQATWVRPDQVALVLAGDITPEAGLALAQRLLGDWRAPATALPALALAPPKPLDSPLVLVDLPGAGQTCVAVAAPFVAQASAERRTGLVAHAVLAGGYSARLNQAVRVRRGLSYGVSGAVEALVPGGMASALAQTAHANAPEVLALLRGEVLRLADAPPSADELAARQAALVGGFGRRLETTAGLAAVLASQWAAGRPLADLAAHVPQLLAVTPAQVQDFARRHWTAGALRGVVVGDLSATGDALTATVTGGPAALRLRMAEVDFEQPGLRKPR